MTGQEAARLLGVSRRTLYRWHHEGRLYCWQWTVAHLTAHAAQLAQRPRGPKRNPMSRRYHEGRHRFAT